MSFSIQLLVHPDDQDSCSNAGPGYWYMLPYWGYPSSYDNKIMGHTPNIGPKTYLGPPGLIQ